MATPLTLKVFRGEELLRTERFNREIIKIGRLATAHLILDDDKVSRIHSVIEIGAGGAISIIDMGSAEGTFVNGKKVSRGALRPGDQITLGGLRIVVEAVDAAVPEPIAPVIAVAPAPVSPAPEAAPPPAPANTAAPFNRVLRPAQDERAPAAEPAPKKAAGNGAANGTSAHASAVPGAVAVPLDRGEDLLRPAREAGGGASAAVAAVTAPVIHRLAPAQPHVEDLTHEKDYGVELRLLWGDTLLDAGTFVRPKTPVRVGEGPGCALRFSGVELPAAEFPMLRFEDGDYRFAFARGMTGVLEERGARTPLAQLVREKKASPDEKLDGTYWIGVPKAGAIRAELGAHLAVEARARRPAAVKAVPWWDRLDYAFLNLFLVLFFLQAGFIVAANNYPYDTDVLADDLFKNPSRMAKFIIKPPEPQKKVELPKGGQKDDPGEMAEKHKGEEGQMGKKDAPKTNARSAPKAIDPNAKDQVRRMGLLGALGRGGGGGLSTIMGQGGLGGDLKGAVGNMFGPTVGDSYGLGGLGIRGSGSGGGGQGETIGIGAVGTKGRGGGLGSYGTGVGGLGRKGDRDVSVSAGTAVVMGSIDRELVRKVIQDHASQIRYCYEQQLALNPKLSGKVSIKWIINADGSATGAQIEGGATTLQDDKVHDCMRARIQSWQFPKPKGGGIAVITYPWILRSSGAQ
jgi:hypothetical protein